MATLIARTLALATAAGCLAAATHTAQAQPAPPMAEASVDALVEALDGGPRARAFMRTELPDVATNRCQASRQRPAPGGNRAADDNGPAGRNLEVVAYAGDSTAGVNLDIGFGLGSDQLSARELALLDNLAKALRDPRLAKTRFAVAGHTDASGKPQINLELSCARALKVVAYLQKRGIAEQRMTAYGFGSSRPLEGLAADSPQHRRTEIRLAP